MNGLNWYWRLFVDVWRMFKKYHATVTDQEFQELLEEGTRLHEKYPGQLASELIQATLWEIDRRAAEHGYEKVRCKKDRG